MMLMMAMMILDFLKLNNLNSSTCCYFLFFLKSIVKLKIILYNKIMKNKKDIINEEEEIIKAAKKTSFFKQMFGAYKVQLIKDNLIKFKKFNVQKRGEVYATFNINLAKSNYYLIEAKDQAYHNYYEEFMTKINGKEVRDDVKYSEYLAECLDDINYLYFIRSLKEINELKNQGLNIENLSDSSKMFFKKTLDLKDKCGITKDFNYESFYNIRSVRNDIASKIRFYLKDLEKTEFGKNDKEDMER